MIKALIACAALTTLAGCSIADRYAGVQNRWRGLERRFERGVTKQRDVLDALGPPSRILSLGDREVFYYVLEHSHSVGLNLVLHVDTDTVLRYDRACFFFDRAGKLEDYALSSESIAPEDER